MRKILVKIVICAIAGLAAGGGNAVAEEMTVKSVIDFSKPDDAAKQAEALRGLLSGPEKIIYLDLAVLPESNNGKFDYRVSRTLAKDGSSRDVKCDESWQRFSGASSDFTFNFNSVDNHFFLSIRHEAPAQAPYSTIACEYMAQASDQPAFAVRGYFAKSTLSIPTAIDIELRPVSP